MNKETLAEFIEQHKTSYIRIIRRHHPEVWSMITSCSLGDSPAEKFFNYVKTDNTESLCYCGSRLTFLNYQLGYRKHCSSKCRANSNEQQQKTRKTNFLKYGTKSYVSSIDFKEKSERTLLEKYGVTNAMHVKSIKNKVKNTLQVKYGVSCSFLIPNVKEKTQVFLSKHGVTNSSQIASVFEKQQKTSYRSKVFVTPSNNKVFCRGYEPVVLVKLYKKFDEELVFTSASDMPRIWYFNSAKNRMAKYYPDIFLPSKNLIIEVKSEYTYKDDLKTNIEKKNACLALGLEFTFVICNANIVLRIEGVNPF